MSRDREQWRTWALDTLENKILPLALQTKQLTAAVAAVREAKEILAEAFAESRPDGTLAHMSTDDLYKQLDEVTQRARAALAEKEAEPPTLLGEDEDASDAALDAFDNDRRL